MKKIHLTEKDLRSLVKETLTEVLNENVKEHWDREKKYYFSIEERAQNPNENVMERYYNIEYNDYRPVLLKETTLDRILIKHGQNGFVCVSANRSDWPKEVNDENTKQLIGDIKKEWLFLFANLWWI